MNGGSGAAAGVGIMYMICCGITVLVMIPLFAFWIWMLIDVIKRVPSEENKKLIWILVVVLAGFIGAAIYYFVQRPKNPPEGGSPPQA
jgi:hypothetical protein